jgi:hypothetical protein
VTETANPAQKHDSISTAGCQHMQPPSSPNTSCFHGGRRKGHTPRSTAWANGLPNFWGATRDCSHNITGRASHFWTFGLNNELVGVSSSTYPRRQHRQGVCRVAHAAGLNTSNNPLSQILLPAPRWSCSPGTM